MSPISRIPGRISSGLLPPLPASFRETFRGRECFAGSIPQGRRVFRDLGLLDFTSSDLGGLDPGNRARLTGRGGSPEWTASGKTRRPWSVAAWRAELQAVHGLYAWVGAARPMAFDVFTGKRYRGPGDSTQHVTRPGGGSQVLVHRSSVPKLRVVSVSSIPRVVFLI